MSTIKFELSAEAAVELALAAEAGLPHVYVEKAKVRAAIHELRDAARRA